MIDIFIKIAPIFLIILTGFILKKKILSDNYFWQTLDKVTYYVLFPSLLILKLSKADFVSLKILDGLMPTIFSTLLLSIMLIGSKYVFRIENKIFTSLFQGGVRYNSYVFIAMSLSLFGDNGVVLSSIFIAYMIIITNIISVIVMSIYGEGNKTVKSIVLSILKNPLIISAFLGVLLSILDVSMPYLISEYLHYIGNAALPMSLLSVGAGLILSFSLEKVTIIFMSSIVKLLLLPAITVLILIWFNTEGDLFFIALLYSSVPCAGNAYILSRQMGGDSESMAAIITLTTVLSSLTIPIVMSIFKVLN